MIFPDYASKLDSSDRADVANDARPTFKRTARTAAACVVARYGMAGDLGRYLSTMSAADRLDACRAIASGDDGGRYFGYMPAS